MKSFMRSLAPLLCLIAAMSVSTQSAAAEQGTAVKEKPRLYTYVSNWVIPRGKWDDMQKADAANQKILDGAVGNSTILGYGTGEILVHHPEGSTHNDWWISNSMAGLLDVLDQFYKSKTPTSAVLTSATKHWDNVYESQYYGWRAGTVRGGYVHGAAYKLRADAPNDAVETLSKSFIVPLFEKLTAEGSVQAWQVAEEAIHTSDPGMFFVFYITPDAKGIDKTNAALRTAIGENSLALPALASMVDFSAHRDDLGRSNATFK
ncbi:MAG: hypothetical protein JOZ93_10585 [Sinobacteraceae bacterium]|nr:hypothetical protein [Nevskiaceae bacterium]